MMARKDRFPEGCTVSIEHPYESEGSGSSGRIDTEMAASEDSTAPLKKWIDLNSATRTGFDVPIQVLRLAKLSQSQKKHLILRLRSELEKIQVLKKKIDQQKANAVLMSSSDIVSYSNTRKGPKALNAKKPSNLASGSGKKPNSSGQNGRCGTSGRFESAKPGPVLNSNATLLKQCENLLKKLTTRQFAWVFNEPVDPVRLNIPDYFTVIRHPMDLGTISTRLASGQYSGPLEFASDVRLTFSNAMAYNPRGNDVHTMAETLSKFFEVRWKAIEKKLHETSSISVPEKSGFQDEAEVFKPTAPAKKRKLSPSQYAATPEPVKRRMTEEEKNNLSRELEAMLGDLPDNIIEFLKEQNSNGAQPGEDEIEIDIDELSDDALFKLRTLLDEHLHRKQKIDEKSERCEIELPNELGLSTSSMQVDKGDDVGDEDIGTGGKELHVSSYIPTENDKGLKSNKSALTGSSNHKSVSGSNGSSRAEIGGVAFRPTEPTVDLGGSMRDVNENTAAEDLAEGNHSVSRLDQLEQSSQEKPDSDESDSRQDAESAPSERPVSPEKLCRAAVLKNRFADTILRAREKALGESDKGDPEKLRRKREKLEMQKIREKARLQAEAKAAEDARKRAEAEAAADAKRKRELERAAARQALQEMEKTVEIHENSRFLQDLEMLRAGNLEQLPSSVDETSPDHLQEGFDGFKFEGSNPLEQLGLYMKPTDEEEEDEPASIPDIVNDVEEGEID